MKQYLIHNIYFAPMLCVSPSHIYVTMVIQINKVVAKVIKLEMVKHITLTQANEWKRHASVCIAQNREIFTLFLLLPNL